MIGQDTRATTLMRAISARSYFASMIGKKTSYMSLLMYANKDIGALSNKGSKLRVKVVRIMTLDPKTIFNSDHEIMDIIDSAVEHLKVHGWK